jgi:hypothetical protein
MLANMSSTQKIVCKRPFFRTSTFLNAGCFMEYLGGSLDQTRASLCVHGSEFVICGDTCLA